MESHWGTPNHRKRKRRRGPDRPPIPAQLILDTRLKGDVGLLSEDLYFDLFPSSSRDNTRAAIPDSEARYIAIAPQPPNSQQRYNAYSWTFLAVRKSNPRPFAKEPQRSTIHFSATSNALQSFAQALQKLHPQKGHAILRSPFDVLVLDVAPIGLDTITVSVDHEALTRHTAALQSRLGRSNSRRRGSIKSETDSDSAAQSRRLSGHFEAGERAQGQWDQVVRGALAQVRMIHSGDFLPLPMDTHPITYANPPPAVVEFCEPVIQGLLLPRTRIVIMPSARRDRLVRNVAAIYPPANGVNEEDEDTSNEQFFSAAEERTQSPAQKLARRKGRIESSDADTETEEDTDMSDVESEGIGLSLPGLSAPSSGLLSGFSSATPRPGQPFTNGIASPGSVISTFSTATVRGGGSKGRLFKAQGLYERVPNESIQPQPPADEDDEARVFVDTNALVKLGCFSGDWVRLEAAHEHTLGSLGMDAFHTSEEYGPEWRVAKIYAKPGPSESKPRYLIDRSGNRRGSLSLAHLQRPNPEVHLSPVLLANLGDPQSLRIAPLAPSTRGAIRADPRQHRITSSTRPPPAKEVTVYRLTTPIATEKNMMSGLFCALKTHFESKQRIVKRGDLIGVPVDASLSRAMFNGTAKEEDTESEDMITRTLESMESEPHGRTFEVAWFQVGPIVLDRSEEDFEPGEESIWGGAAVFRLGVTRMSQTGTEQGKTPPAVSSRWQYYLGSRRMPPRDQIGTSAQDFVSPTQRKLRELIAAATSPHAAPLGLPPVAILLYSTQRHAGKTTAATRACLDLGIHCFAMELYDIVNESRDVTSAGVFESRAERGLTCGAEYTALLLKHVDALTGERMSVTLAKILEESRIIIATTNEIEKVQEGVRALFTHEIEIAAPDEGQREGLLRDLVQERGIAISPDVDLGSVALRTAALVAGDLSDVVDRAVIAKQERLEQIAHLANERNAVSDVEVTTRDIELAGGIASRSVIKPDFDVAVEAARKNFADAIGAPKIPNVSWDDVGGLTHVKDAVIETIQLPLERPELFAKGMKKRSGILFYGPPGTGKTLLAKAIATEFSLNFFSVKGPELLNMYIGESEANVRRVFQRARDARPCVVFFDELDSVAPKRGNQGDSGGVMDRIVSQLLAELDGMGSGDDAGGGVFVIGATNRPDLLDTALLRPGRFDKMLYLGVSDTHDKQLTILEALTRKFTLHHSLSLPAVAAKLPFTYTGADLYALCSDAMLKAITRRSTLVQSKVRSINANRPAASPISIAYFFDHLATAEDTEVTVMQDDFSVAAQELVPSVSAKELAHYETVRRVFETVDQVRGHQNAADADVTGRNGNQEDDFVIRTGELSIGDGSMVNGTSNDAGSAQGKAKSIGKGKQKATAADFADATDGDSDLYSLGA